MKLVNFFIRPQTKSRRALGLALVCVAVMPVVAQHDLLQPYQGEAGKTLAETQQPARGSVNEGLLIGKDIVTPVSESYKVPFTFTGKLKKVVIELKEKYNTLR